MRGANDVKSGPIGDTKRSNTGAVFAFESVFGAEMRCFNPDNRPKGLSMTSYFASRVWRRSSGGPWYPFNSSFAIGAAILAVAVAVAVTVAVIMAG